MQKKKSFFNIAIDYIINLKKELQDLGVTKIPSSDKIQKQIENLESEQAATVREKQELQKKKDTGYHQTEFHSTA